MVPTALDQMKAGGEMTEPRWPNRKPISADELKKERKRLHSLNIDCGTMSFNRGYTCDECTDVRRCCLAFDPMNTHGFCLVGK